MCGLYISVAATTYAANTFCPNFRNRVFPEPFLHSSPANPLLSQPNRTQAVLSLPCLFCPPTSITYGPFPERPFHLCLSTALPAHVNRASATNPDLFCLSSPRLAFLFTPFHTVPCVSGPLLPIHSLPFLAASRQHSPCHCVPHHFCPSGPCDTVPRRASATLTLPRLFCQAASPPTAPDPAIASQFCLTDPFLSCPNLNRAIRPKPVQFCRSLPIPPYPTLHTPFLLCLSTSMLCACFRLFLYRTCIILPFGCKHNLEGELLAKKLP